jgi:preprotein translocase subunit SecD
MKFAVPGLIAMLALPAWAQPHPELAFYGARPCAASAPEAQREPDDGEIICLDSKPVFGGAEITAVSADVDNKTGKETAIVTLGGSGSALLYAFTRDNAGHRMAVTLDGRLLSAPLIFGANGAGQVTVYGLSHAQIAALIARYEAKTK